MTNQHPITPPPYLTQQWLLEAHHKEAPPGTCPDTRILIARAAQWGWDQRGTINEAQLQERADQELEACRCEVSFWVGKSMADRLQATRRPKPPSLKEQALEALGRMDQFPTTEDKVTILRALEQLDD